MAQATWVVPTNAFPGLLADLANSYIRSHVNEEANPIPFGIGVVQGTLDNDCLLPSTANAWRNFLGVTVHSHAYDNQALAGTNGLAADAVGNVIIRGPVYVRVEQGVTPASPVFCRFAVSGGFTQLGRFRGESHGGTCFRVGGARFLTSAAEGELAVLYVPGVRVGYADPEFFQDPAVSESFDYGATSGLSILTVAHAAYNAAAGTINVMHTGEGRKIAMVPIVGQTQPPVMAATGLNIGCDQVNNDGLELVSHYLGLSGRPFIVGRDPAFYFSTRFNIADVSGTDYFRIGFRTLEAHAADAETYNSFATIGVLTSAALGPIQIRTRAGAGVTTTDTTQTLADGVNIILRVNVSAAGVVTYTINGLAPVVTAAHTMAGGLVVVPFLSYLQDAGLTGNIILSQWEVGYQ
jgi:hypothetical protein